MIGVDTNVLMRYFLDDDPVWSPIADRFLDRTPERPGYVSPVTLVELVWPLRKHPDYQRSGMVRLIEGLLAFENIVVGQASAVVRALSAYKAGGAGFADYLVAELNRDAGAEFTVTIDRKAASHDLFNRLPDMSGDRPPCPPASSAPLTPTCSARPSATASGSRTPN